MSQTITSAGKPPRNKAILKYSDLLGGFECLQADYSKQTFPRHSHEEYLVGVIEDGVHDVWCRGEWWHASRDVVATFSPDEAHYGGLGDSESWRQTIFYFPEQLVAEALDDTSGTYRFDQPFQHSPLIAAKLLRLRQLLANEADTLLLEQELLDVIGMTFSHVPGNVQSPRGDISPEMRRVCAFIHDNLHDVSDLTELSELAGLSKRQFMDHFRKEFHIAPYQYVMLVRVRRAKDLLRMGGSISDAALGAGFSDQSHLTRNFKAIYGVTPARYIQQCA